MRPHLIISVSYRQGFPRPSLPRAFLELRETEYVGHRAHKAMILPLPCSEDLHFRLHLLTPRNFTPQFNIETEKGTTYAIQVSKTLNGI